MSDDEDTIDNEGEEVDEVDKPYRVVCFDEDHDEAYETLLDALVDWAKNFYPRDDVCIYTAEEEWFNPKESFETMGDRLKTLHLRSAVMVDRIYGNQVRW